MARDKAEVAANFDASHKAFVAMRAAEEERIAAKLKRIEDHKANPDKPMPPPPAATRRVRSHSDACVHACVHARAFHCTRAWPPSDLPMCSRAVPCVCVCRCASIWRQYQSLLLVLGNVPILKTIVQRGVFPVACKQSGKAFGRSSPERAGNGNGGIKIPLATTNHPPFQRQKSLQYLQLGGNSLVG